jgi:Putative metal-binding motif
MRRLFILATLLASLTVVSPPANATCAGGFTTYLAGQPPEIRFVAGVAETITFTPWYASFVSSSGSCGIFARSTTPGVSIQDSYGCPGNGCTVWPTGQWAAVGNAYDTGTGSVAQKTTGIPIIYDGSSGAGTYGTVEIGIRDNDLGIDSEAVIGVMNVYVESATPPPTWFGLSTTASTVSGDHVVLDNPYLNGNYAAKLFVSHVRNPGGSNSGTSWNHPIAVVYDNTLQRWTIRNTDGTAMPTGLGFGAHVDPTALTYCTSSFPGTYTSVTVDHPLSNNNVWATLSVTPIAGGAHPVAVQYVSPSWHIVYQDGAPIPPGTCFNVQVLAFTQYLDDPAAGDLSSRTGLVADWGTGVDVQGDGTGHTSGTSRLVEFDWALSNPFRQVMLTYNLTPLGFTSYFDAKYFGLSAPNPIIIGRRWAIYQEDGSSMPLGDRFNLWAPCAANAWYPDVDGDGYGTAGPVVASCAPPTGYAARAGDCDDANSARYPGLQEINDGIDNQCPGDPGYGLIDELTGEAFFDDATNLCWQTQSGAAMYDVARSGQRTFSTCSYLTSTTSSCVQDAAVPSAGQAFYYLVRAASPFTGSWGARSSGQERILTCQ